MALAQTGPICSVQGGRFARFVARREYEILADPGLSARLEAYRRYEARLLLILLVSLVAVFVLILALHSGG